MKNHRWLSVAEYVMLLGSGVGSVATAASQQALYTIAPISALLILNVLNHRRLEQAAQETSEAAIAQLDQKFVSEFQHLRQQMQTLPSPLHLATLRKDLQGKNQKAFDELSYQIQSLRQDVAHTDWVSLSRDLGQVREQYATLADSVAGVWESLRRLNGLHQVEPLEAEMRQLKADLATLQNTLATVGTDQKVANYRILQDQIAHLNRRLSKLPAPFDASVLQQNVDALVKALGEMAHRSDLTRLEMQLQKLNRQQKDVDGAVLPLKVVTNVLKKQVDTVAGRLRGLEDRVEPLEDLERQINPAVVEALQGTVTRLEQQVQALPKAMDGDEWRSQVEALVTGHLETLQVQLEAVQQQTETLDQQQHTLREWLHCLPQVVEPTALQGEMQQLAHRMEWAETHLSELQAKVMPHADAQWVLDVQGRDDQPESTAADGRGLLARALQEAEARVVVVYPVPTPEVLDDQMMQQFQQFLERRGCLDIGWGQLEETPTDGASPAGMAQPLTPPPPLARSIDRRRGINRTDHPFLFDRLNQLMELKKQYPDQLRFKVLGTNEFFLVCDRTYAILGTQSVSTTSVLFPAAAVGLRTTERSVIQTLVDWFDNPVLDRLDTAAFFNRAEARYDLGNRQGAIADYTSVLTINPNDAVARNNRALVYYDLGQKDAALADLDLAIQADAHHFVAYTNRGYLRSEQGDKLGAIEDYTFALHLNPDYATAYFYRGLARTRMQNKLGAIADYTEVIRLNPEDASAYFYRGLANAKVGERMDAVRDLREATQLFAEQGDRANYQQALTALKKLQKLLVIGGTAKPLVSNGA